MDVRQGENVGFSGQLKTDLGDVIRDLSVYESPSGNIKILIWSTNGGSVFLSSDDDDERITIDDTNDTISFGLRGVETAKLLGQCNFEMKLTTGTAEEEASIIGVTSIFRVYQSNIGGL
jgi:hypothetical protein